MGVSSSVGAVDRPGFKNDHCKHAHHSSLTLDTFHSSQWLLVCWWNLHTMHCLGFNLCNEEVKALVSPSNILFWNSCVFKGDCLFLLFLGVGEITKLPLKSMVTRGKVPPLIVKNNNLPQFLVSVWPTPKNVRVPFYHGCDDDENFVGGIKSLCRHISSGSHISHTSVEGLPGQVGAHLSHAINTI